MRNTPKGGKRIAKIMSTKVYAPLEPIGILTSFHEYSANIHRAQKEVEIRGARVAQEEKMSQKRLQRQVVEEERER